MSEKTLFYLKRCKINKETGLIPIYLRITFNGKREEISVGKSIDPADWDIKTHRAKGKKSSAKALNICLVNYEDKINQIINHYQFADKPITAGIIKKSLTGKLNRHYTLIEACDVTLNRIKSLIGKDYCESTYEKYKYTKMRVIEYLRIQLNLPDILLEELDRKFIDDFDIYMKTQNNIVHNSAAKYIKNLKVIVKEAKNNKWIEKDPFEDYKCSYNKTNKEYLTMEEIKAIENEVFLTPGLELVRDAFILAVYTGYAFVDLMNLRYENIIVGNDYKKWIVINRSKTGIRSPVRLLLKPIEIIDRYRNNPICEQSGKIIPLYSHQKVNEYLKKISTICGINKRITFHTARYTYATTVTLSNGVPIETVSKTMGHTNINQTLDYANLTDAKVSQDFDNLEIQLKVRDKEFEKHHAISNNNN